MPSPHVVTLGTAGGPRWWDRPGAAAARSGISTAVVVGDAIYLVDAGQGAGRQLTRAGLRMDQVRALFLTHLHSDHVADLTGLLLFGLFERREPDVVPLAVHGPGPRGVLPPLSPHANLRPEPVAPANPTPGTAEMIELLCAAHATDLNDRIFDSLTSSPADQLAVHDIELPAGTGFDPDHTVAPPMEPIEIFRDDRVLVTATLVDHPPTAPAYAFRFDTADGSVTISGDTAPCDNLVRLGRDTDLLLHEAIDLDAISSRYTDEAMRRATMEHHRRAHTTPRQAGEIATAATARALVLHHLVPGDSPASSFLTASETFDGPLLIPDDLDVIEFAVGARLRTEVA
ncbi:MBL fold metallo-hydrolase [Saccharopolyspora aridisoli]|uniref:MBL fold metallo-hydrolase n=1 Tax=Saccharopolyspora aridisoli TaxID=2530385 RepID=A0A4R4UL75_9PSEU|nr:MBL fold metallo-hydrolase [Saccharopolyspora aridisoli]TDC90976.1 MBL fold metallo-hydrolase [Saccharopolyspora aridisoli]